MAKAKKPSKAKVVTRTKRVAKKPVVKPVEEKVVLPNAADYEGYIDKSQEVVGEDSLAALRNLAVELMDRERTVADAEEALEKAQAQLAVIREHRIPDMLDQVGLPEFTFVDESGAAMVIKVGNEYHVSMPKDKAIRDRGFAWIEGIGKGSVIKQTVEIPVGRDPGKLPGRIAKAIAKIDKTLEIAFLKKVEPSTLRSLIINLIEGGKKVPDDLFTIHNKRVANVTTK